MEQKRSGKRTVNRKSPIFFLLACVMLVGTLVTPFIYYSPENCLARAVAKTREEFFADETLIFLSEVLRDGSVEAVGESSSLSYTATLPESAAVAEQGAFGSRRIALQGDTLYLRSDALGKGAYSAPRGNASVKLCDSAFSDAGMPDPQMRLFRTALALSEADRADAGEVLEQIVQRVLEAGAPELRTTSGKMKIDGKERRTAVYTYEMEKKGIKDALNEWKKAGKTKEAKAAYSALRQVLSATLSKDETEQAAKRFTSFLCGSSKEFAAFEKEILSENTRLALTFTVYRERILSMHFVLGGGELVFEAKMTFDADPAENASWSAFVQAKSGGKKLFSLSLDSAITEDSDSALIRKWGYSYSDSVGAVCAASGKESGSLTFSWGKGKGDLGLRLVLGERELVFRGELSEYEEGEKLTLILKRLEYDRKNILEDESYTVTFSKKGETPAHRPAEGELFPSGEKRRELAEHLAAKFQRLPS